MFKPLNEKQLKEVTYQQNFKDLKNLAENDPDAIIIYGSHFEAIISENSDLPYSFDSAADFLKWRLFHFDEDLNRLADELGYDTEQNNHADFIQDISNYDNLEDYVMDSYSSERITELLA